MGDPLSDARVLVVSHPAVLPVNQLPYAELVRRGWDVNVIAPARWRHEYADGVFEPRALPELAGRLIPKRVALAGRPQRHFHLCNPFDEIRRRRPDVIFCEQESFSVPAAQWGLAACVLGVPFGVQSAENMDRPLPVPARLIRGAILPRAAFVAARSQAAVRLVRQWGARGDIRLIPHHVPGWPLPERPRHEAFVVGFAGRLAPEKGLETLAGAVRRLEWPVELLVAGDGPLREWLASADIGSARLRHLRGIDHADMADLYAQMDVLVLPSRTTPTWTEQFGRVLVEAMWCGTPVIGSDSGEIPWVIETTGGGVVFPERDEVALGGCLRRLRNDVSLRRQLGERGQEHVQMTFTVRAVTDGLERLLLKAVRTTGAAR